ncbi:MAG TPA: hypothetical protein DDW52_03220 [Planctomycetaceae bacterium]|nr:hypothetical protein [Planctomycetaceae bacterium]
MAKDKSDGRDQRIRTSEYPAPRCAAQPSRLQSNQFRQALAAIASLATLMFASCVPEADGLVTMDAARGTISSEQTVGPANEVEPSTTSEPSPQTSPKTSSDALQQRVLGVLETALEHRSMDTTVNAAWQILHGVVAFGPDLMINTPDRGEVPALEYAFSGGVINGFELSLGDVHPTSGRRGIKARLDPGSYSGQGHVDQWIAICAMCNLPPDTPVQVGEQELTVRDWARQAQYDVSENYLDEYGWTLIALTHYLPEETQWIAKDGNVYSIEDLVAAEINIDLTTAACGGTHSLAGVVRAIRLRERAGLPGSETWAAAEQLVQRCIANARQFRAGDGRLSTNYFDGPGISVDLSVELSSAGHVFEFLALALPDNELAEPWVERSLERICELLESAEAVDLECGSLYHALNGLKIYAMRRYAS